ncbi:aldehyde dehydrogenase family protein [Gordonia jinghuaiqii]|uniref:aldehyde dehydrogenase (NAD(+)) n=1 Tax=Gordonia jinghuaiqii TaxID=2758710 RepID=A0A7D7QGZ1_9ACTN|nr:aldehyde dehydrogenase family protein [Gordonia jinghuaiqii]MCR5977513.1 aldehyde dehydrogenase family protein [Gordonia jinghuaiqii]QMT02202.1 aldehyde dehydrogenase family protein [Gordonia jinghuaiqii]
MQVDRSLFIDGTWTRPLTGTPLDVINPADGTVCAVVSMGDAADVKRAVAAARTAFESFGRIGVDERIALLEAVIRSYEAHSDELVSVLSAEMGAPVTLAAGAQVPSGLGHFVATLEALKSFAFEERIGTTRVVHEPIGVCGLITPWNWPLNQIAAKVAPALATGCTMVLKPSEIAPLNAIVFTKVLAAAGVPAGVFNLVNGDGPTVGTALAEHPDVAMMSFTGSTRAGIEVARTSARTVKRVSQELGGKSATVILDDADLEQVVTAEVQAMYQNSGQSCNAGSRMLVPAHLVSQVEAIVRKATAAVVVGDPRDAATDVGPVVSEQQFDKVQDLIDSAIREGAELVVGGLGRPDGLEEGYYARPTVFSHVTAEMRIWREEVFGPVLVVAGYTDEDSAVAMANDSEYGLSGKVYSASEDRAWDLARRLRTGMVHINGAPLDNRAPFGGYKHSGNGREFGAHGLREFLETKSVYIPA